MVQVEIKNMCISTIELEKRCTYQKNVTLGVSMTLTTYELV